MKKVYIWNLYEIKILRRMNNFLVFTLQHCVVFYLEHFDDCLLSVVVVLDDNCPYKYKEAYM